ncbi:neuronal acetylcholine receptor subunit alpha-3-like [Saccoglossus kowalevskii]|uniref:Neuronal acetylcholine receptor subunit alpha-3-like n=1 Tax=Saccoglossus kowalevskii TaxID=10224 RepID=A0ABM0GK89_SACKO|nr:PREDICTED: neuronal acetylcholine receptor subunit alpha-3-like [Saccoglossus kowalevskii]
MTTMIFCAWAIILALVPMVTSSNLGANLVNELLENYPSFLRPVKNDSVVTIVKHRMTPIQIIDVEEQNQVIILKAWLGQVWHDEYLVWNESEYGGVDEIQLPITRIWQPDITLHGSVHEEFIRHYDTDARVTSDGQVTALQPFVFRSSCSIDATYFPFDHQRCYFKFGSWVYPIHLIDLIKDGRSNLDTFIDNGEWNVIEMPVQRNVIKFPCCPEKFPDVTYIIHLKRRSLFYVFNIIFPAFLVSVLVVIGFYLPSDSGERITLCVSSMLSLMVFLSTVSEYMPPNSENTPHIQRYLFITIGLVAMSCATTAMTLNIHFHGPNCDRPSRWLRILVFDFLACVLCTRVRFRKDGDTVSSGVRGGCCQHRTRSGGHRADIPKSDSLRIYNNFVQNESLNIIHRNSNKVNKDQILKDAYFYENSSICENTKATEIELLSSDRLQEWKEIARILDRLFLLVYAIAVLSLTSGVLAFLIANDGREFNEQSGF